MGQNTHFSQMNFVEEIYLSFGNQSWRRHRGGMNPGTPPFFLSQPSNLRQASQIWESRNLSFRLLNVFLGGGVQGRETKKRNRSTSKLVCSSSQKRSVPQEESQERHQREHRLPNKSKATCPYFISSFQKQFSGVGEVPCPPPFPQSYCCHLSSLHISYRLSSKGDETLRFHIFPPNPKMLPSFEQGEGELCKGHLTGGSQTIFISLVPGSPKLI